MQKVILVTGVGSGLGKEIAALFSGKNIVYGTTRNLKDFDENSGIAPVKLDVTDDSECKEAVEAIVKKERRLDVLINNAGYTISGPEENFSALDFQKILEVNTVGPFRLIKYVIPQMKKQKKGYIVNITSLNGLISLPNFGLYSASKHALEALGIALHYELKKFGISVTNVAPGAIYSGTSTLNLKHKPAREKFRFLYFLMPMVTKQQVAKRVESVVNSANPPAEIVIGNDAKILTFVRRLSPSFVWEHLMNFVWNKK